MTSTWLRIGGVPATEIAPHAPPTWETLADGGCGEASFALALSRRSQHQALRVGSLVEILSGPVPVWVGLLMEPDRTTWECHAFGLSGSLRSRLAFDSVGSTTRDVSVAVAEAMGRGWRGSNPSGVSGVAAGDADGNPVSVGALLDDRATELGQRWGVDHRGALFMRPDPVAPLWLAAPGSAAFGNVSEDAPTALAGRYFDGTSNQTVFVGSGDDERSVDLTDRGALTGPQAAAILAGSLARSGGTGWTNGATLTRDQLTTSGGTPANLMAVRAGQMVRAHGLSYGVKAGTPWLDVVIGKTRYTAGSKSIYVEPVNASPIAGGLRGVIAAA